MFKPNFQATLGIALLCGLVLWITNTVPAAFRLLPASAQEPISDSSLFYYSDNRRIPLTVLPDTLMVRMSPGISAQGITEKLTQSGLQLAATEMSVQALDNDLNLVSISQTATTDVILQTVTNLSRASNVELVGPVFGTQNDMIIVTDEITVQFKENVSQDEIVALNRTLGTEIVQESPYVQNNYLLRSSATNTLEVLAIANRYYENPLVNYAHPNFTLLMTPASAPPNDTYYNDQWYLEVIDAPQAWDLQGGGSPIVIAVLDEGIDIGHPDLMNKIVFPKNFIDNNNDPTPPLAFDPYSITGAMSRIEGHGTAVSGIAVAQSNNNKGVSGVCPNCLLMPIRIFKGQWIFEGLDFKYKTATTSQIIAGAINYARQNGADVMNFSWRYYPTDDIDTAITNASVLGRGGKGAVVVAATGNDDINAVSWPASHARVTAVGATNKCDTRKTKMDSPICGGETGWGSNYGSGISLMAPGISIWTTDVRSIGGFNRSLEGDYYSSFNGTSSATPIVSGVAGLMLSRNPLLTSVQVNQILANTARDIGPKSGFDPETGYGLVDARAALLATPLPQIYLDFTTSVGYEVDVEIYATNVGQNTGLQWIVPKVPNGNGRLQLTNLPPGRYDLYAKPSGYLRRKIGDRLLQVGNNSVNFSSSENGGPFVIGDIDPYGQDNVINSVDLVRLLTLWGLSSSIADLNRNGTVEINDLLILLNNFGRKGDGWQERGPFGATASNVETQDITTMSTLPMFANSDFELGSDGAWVESSSNSTSLISNSGLPLTPRSGSWVARLGALNNETADLSQSISIPAGGPVYLHYWYQIGSEEVGCTFDIATIVVNSTEKQRYELCQANNTTNWALGTINVSEYAGQTVTIHFHVRTNTSISSNFYIDDVFFADSIDAPGRITLTPKSGVFNVGDTFDMVVRLDTGNYASEGANVKIFYDPGVLEVQDVLAGSETFDYIQRQARPSLGEVEITVRGVEGQEVFQGNLTLAVIPFRVIAGINNTEVQVYYRDGWSSDSNIGQSDTALDILGQVNTATFQTIGSPSRSMPTLSFTPAPNTILNTSLIGLEAQATDPYTQVKEVKFEVNLGGIWTAIGSDTSSSDGWRLTWDATSVPDGNYQMRATALLLGGQGTTVTNNNITIDRSIPSYVTSHISPTAIPSAGVPVTIEVTAADAVSGVDSIDVYANLLDDSSGNITWRYLGSIENNQGSIVWNTTNYSAGNYQIAFNILDKAGNSGPNLQPQVFFEIGVDKYEAESSKNTLIGQALIWSCSICSNGYDVAHLGYGGAIRFNDILGRSDGEAVVKIYYINGEQTNRYVTISVNGKEPTTLEFAGSGDWNTTECVKHDETTLNRKLV